MIMSRSVASGSIGNFLHEVAGPRLSGYDVSGYFIST